MTDAEPPGSRVEAGHDQPPFRALHLSSRPRPISSRSRVDAVESPPRSSRLGKGTGGKREGGSVGSFLRELPLLVLVAFVLAFALRTFVVQVFYIPSSSMEPTLMVNDRILVDKITYRFRELRRGEVVVFEGDELMSDDEVRGPLETLVHGVAQLIGIAPANARDYIKRVIGLPGDRIHIDESGRVHVNDVALDEPYVASEDPRPYGPINVPEGSLFFLGDNRPNSSDSRFQNLGFVQRDHVVGKAFLAIWPLERAHFLRTPSYPPIPAPSPLAAAIAPAAWRHPGKRLVAAMP